MIRVDDHNSIRVLTLERPPVNALDPELLTGVADAVRRAAADDVSGIVLTGREGLFSAGLDLPILVQLERPAMAEALAVFFDAIVVLASSARPVVAAISGHSPAGGAVLGLCCDRRVMARGPFAIGLNEVQVGLPMPRMVAALARRAVGPRRAEELLVPGRMVSPDEAFAIGLVDQVVPPESVLDESMSWLAELAARPRRAMLATREVMREDLVAELRRHRAADTDRLLEEWFRPEVHRELENVVRQLKGGRADD